ncbi:MAG: succinate dehydrogenase [Chlamydiae bacterium]|nr:succinate dehydrogenase [Chlamydiota bacterium]
MAIQSMKVPKEFLFRRIHSLMGFWFLIFLMEHLFTNSQMALFFTNGDLWFVRSVDFLNNLPYLHVIEILLLGVPILYHAVWGVMYMFTSKSNAFFSKGNTSLIKTGRNRAYWMQRMSAWVILVGIILHVAQMRVLNYPYKYQNQFYLPISVDPDLYSLANRLHVELYNPALIQSEQEHLSLLQERMKLVETRLNEKKLERAKPDEYDAEMGMIYQTIEKFEALKGHVSGLESRKLKETEVMAVSKSFGNLELLGVREAFRNPLTCVLYTIFVLAAVFHGFNGLWTFLITWGIILSGKAQSKAVLVCTGFMFVLGLLGMMGIWGTFFLG